MVIYFYCHVSVCSFNVVFNGFNVVFLKATEELNKADEYLQKSGKHRIQIQSTIQERRQRWFFDSIYTPWN